jgi:hypothetical protein
MKRGQVLVAIGLFSHRLSKNLIRKRIVTEDITMELIEAEVRIFDHVFDDF